MKSLDKFGVKLHQEKLKNGANLFLFERKGMPISIRAVFFAGSRFDNVPGTAHFLEHMLVAGTERFQSKNLIAEHIEKIGGDFGALTNQDVVQLWLEVPESTDIGVAIDILSECLCRPLFDEETIEKERGAILSELKAKKSNPSMYIHDLSRKIAFQDSNIGNGNLGSEQNIKSINKADIQKHFNDFIHSGRVVLVVSGDIDIKELVNKMDTVPLPDGEHFNIDGALLISNKKQMLVEHYPGLTQFQVALTSRTSIESYAERCALFVLNQILAKGRGSRLMTRLRYENGLVYSVNGIVMDMPDWGRFDIQFSCDKKNYDQAINLIFKEFENLKANNILQSELENTKTRIAKSAIRDMQTSGSWTGFHSSTCLFKPNQIEAIDDFIKTVQGLTFEDIKRAIDKYLNKNNFLIAICGDLE